MLVMADRIGALFDASAPAPESHHSQRSNSRKRRICAICCEGHDDEADNKYMIKPCSICDEDYCIACLGMMFEEAMARGGSMPPKCCAVIQIHTILAFMSDEDAQRYRTKFREWLTADKVYCPVPTCSAFIPAPTIPLKAAESERLMLQEIMEEAMQRIMDAPAARFFRTNMQQDLPRYNEIVKEHIDLAMIKKSLADTNNLVDSLSNKLRLLATNAKAYNGANHPVTQTAEELEGVAMREFAEAFYGAIRSSSLVPPRQSLFACPECHVAICTECRQIEHTGSPCSTLFAEQELALLRRFGYKKCPGCGHAIKKMFGCNTVQCVCGAIMCFHCGAGVGLCHGSCPDTDEIDYDYDEETSEYGGDNVDQEIEGSTAPDTHRPSEPARDNISASLDDGRSDSAGSQNDFTSAAAADHTKTAISVDLDRGGADQWADTGLNFGIEPDVYPDLVQVLFCAHDFGLYKVKWPPFNTGNLSLMECNWCFARLKQPSISQVENSARKRRRILRGIEQTHVNRREDHHASLAWECGTCFLLVCEDCKTKYEKRRRR